MTSFHCCCRTTSPPQPARASASRLAFGRVGGGALFYDFKFLFMQIQTIQKCYNVGYEPVCGGFVPNETIYAETAGKAKVKFDNFADEPFTKIRAVRNRDEDWVLFDGARTKRRWVIDRLKTKEWRSNLEKMVAENQGRSVRIFSGQWNLYWRDNGQGYSETANEAGIYDINDAFSRVCHCGYEKYIIFILVPLS